jgi:hypothetical protein
MVPGCVCGHDTTPRLFFFCLLISNSKSISLILQIEQGAGNHLQQQEEFLHTQTQTAEPVPQMEVTRIAGSVNRRVDTGESLELSEIAGQQRTHPLERQQYKHGAAPFFFS